MKKLISIALTLAIGCCNVLLAQENGHLKVKVNGISEAKGAVAIAIYTTKEGFLKEDYKNIHQKIDNNDIYVVFSDLPEGRYAISLFHDINSNKELDKNFIGLPKEPYGFGNNAKGIFGPPTFEDASVYIRGGTTMEISIEID